MGAYHTGMFAWRRLHAHFRNCMKQSGPAAPYCTSRHPSALFRIQKKLHHLTNILQLDMGLANQLRQYLDMLRTVAIPYSPLDR